MEDLKRAEEIPGNESDNSFQNFSNSRAILLLESLGLNVEMHDRLTVQSLIYFFRKCVKKKIIKKIKFIIIEYY